MAARLNRSRRLATAARWPVGVVLTSWRYMWRTTPTSRRELPGTRDDDSPPELPAGADTADLQPPEAGAGALFHRRYSVRIEGPELSAEELIGALRRDPD